MDLLEEVEETSVDMLITDPSYSTPVMTGFGRKQVKNFGDLSIQETYIKLFKKKIERVLKPAAPVFIFCDDGYYPSIYRAFYDWHSSDLIIWDKGRIGMGNPFRKQHELIFFASRESIDYNRTEGITHYPTILKYKPVERKQRLHRAQKPTELIEDLIKGFTKEGDLVLDTYLGSGSSVVSALRQNRRGLGMEINEEYLDIAESRIKKELRSLEYVRI